MCQIHKNYANTPIALAAVRNVNIIKELLFLSALVGLAFFTPGFESFFDRSGGWMDASRSFSIGMTRMSAILLPDGSFSLFTNYWKIIWRSILDKFDNLR